jgi:hypothetical protein
VKETKAANATVSTYELTVFVGEARTAVVFKVTAELILHFADVLSPHKDTEEP